MLEEIPKSEWFDQRLKMKLIIRIRLFSLLSCYQFIFLAYFFLFRLLYCLYVCSRPLCLLFWGFRFRLRRGFHRRHLSKLFQRVPFLLFELPADFLYSQTSAMDVEKENQEASKESTPQESLKEEEVDEMKKYVWRSRSSSKF